MTRLVTAGALALTAATVRQLFVLSAIIRSRQFLRHGGWASADPAPDEGGPGFFIVVPALREAALLRETVTHMRGLARGYTAQVVVVTTAREAAEAHRHSTAGDTVALARDLAREGRCIHLHYPDPGGRKADQLNYAAAHCAAMLPRGMQPSGVFLVCYDADSRPPPDSLACFVRAIADNPGADVFHQSSRFESRLSHRTAGGLRTRIRQAGSGASALRANRFVLGFEIPRLLNCSLRANRFKRAACSFVYAHVTGHGLCIRLSLMQRLPFPARSPLEDMHYSFILGSHGLTGIAVPSLDVAEVPGSIAAQFQQAERWFAGPARIGRYLADPATRTGWRARLLAASALGSAAEWLACAIVPALAVLLAVAGSGQIRVAVLTFTATCTAQVVLTEMWLGTSEPFPARAVRVLAFPLACTVHGAGGIVGAVRLLAGADGAGKTERAGIL